MIKASRGRILVKLLSVYDGEFNKLNLTIIEKKKHFEHVSRRGVVESVGKSVYGVSVGDVVVFRGDAGFSLDGDPEVDNEIYGKGSTNGTCYRWLKESDCLAILETYSVACDPAVEEPLPEKVLQEAV